MLRAHIFLLLLLILLGSTAAMAEDEPKKPAAPPPRALTDGQAVDAVLAAVKAKDAAALKALAEKDRPDPWLVADLLCYRGEHDAAEAFAKAAPRVDTEQLPAYVEAWRKREPDTVERDLLKALRTATGAGTPEKTLEATASLAPEMDTVVRIMLMWERGRAFARLQRRAESGPLFHALAEAAERLGWYAYAMRPYMQASQDAYRGSTPQAAPASLGKALAIAKRRGDRRSAAKIMINSGVVYQALGDHVKALALYEPALAEAQALGFRPALSIVLLNMGSAHASLGDFRKSLARSERALALLRAAGDLHRIVVTLTNMGRTHLSLGNYAQALALFEEARAASKDVGNRALAATPLAAISHLYKTLGDYEKALKLQKQVLAELQALGDRADAAGATSSIGILHALLGAPEEALAAFELARAEYEALGVRDGVASTLNSIGNLHAQRGDYAKAMALLEQGKAEFEALGHKNRVASLMLNIAQAHEMQGDHARARRLYEKVVRAATSQRFVPLLVDAYTKLTRLHLVMGKPSRALAAARDALRDVEELLGGLGQEEGARARERHASLFALGALAAAREEDTPEAFRFLESGRAGALLDALDKREVLRWKAESLSPELRRLDLDAQAQENVARTAYDRIAKRNDLKAQRAASAALDEAIERVRGVAGRIQRELKQQAGVFYPRAESIEEVEKRLAAGQALVLYGLCQGQGQGQGQGAFDEALALVLRQDGGQIVSLGKVSEIMAACEALDAADRETDAAPGLAALHKLLVAPLKLGGDVKQVLVSPEGPLCYLPFGALFDQPVAMTPSGTTHVLLLDEERDKGKGILALGDPDYGGVSEGAQAIYHRGRGLVPLPGTRLEVETVATTKLLGAKASEAGLRAALPASKRWRAVHFACHGLVDIDRPMLSSLALSRAGKDDGFLTALEILRTKIPADLAVLSACETATGRIVKGEGIVGLTRAFMFAGAPRVICSLWKVDDEATQALMIKFYELWNPKDGTGLGAAAALQKAQAYVRDFKDKDGKQKWKHPYYWAAWVLWGLPN